MIKLQRIDYVFQAKSWLKSGWGLFKKKPLTWVFMVLVFAVFTIVGNSFLVGKFIAAFFLPILAGGLFIGLDRANREQPVGLETLFCVFKDKPVLKEFLTVGMIGVAVVALTMVLQYLTGTEYKIKLETSEVDGVSDVYKQVSEGSVFTSVVSWAWTWAILFGIPLIAINREPAIPALKHSLLGFLLNIIPLLVFFGMIILLTIISILPVGLGLFILAPVLFGATYFAFKEIYTKAEADNIPDLAVELDAITEEKKQQEEESVVYTNKSSHQENDLKEAYRSISIFRMIGMGLVAIGVIFATYTYSSLQAGNNATGEVISMEKSESGSGSSRSVTYKPTFSFLDLNGEKHTASTRHGSSEYNYPIGALVKISYASDDYTSVQINSVKSILYLPMFLWLFGGALLWYTTSAKKNIDKNGVPARKSVFLKEGADSGDWSKELKSSVIDSAPEILDDVSNNKPDNKNSDTDEFIEIVLPPKFTLDLYDDYMHITLSWFGKKTVVFTLIAVLQIGFSLMLFSSDFASNSSLIGDLLPWVTIISGAGTLYYALATWLNKTHVFVSKKTIEIKHKPLLWFGNKRLATQNIKQLYSKKQISESTSNNRNAYHYTLNVISLDEDEMTLLKVENSEQALFIEQEIEKYLGITNLSVRGEIGRASNNDS